MLLNNHAYKIKGTFCVLAEITVSVDYLSGLSLAILSSCHMHNHKEDVTLDVFHIINEITYNIVYNHVTYNIVYNHI